MKYTMLSLPRSGSDWFANQVTLANSLIFYREFFNIRDEARPHYLRDESKIAPLFGGHMHPIPIARPEGKEAEDLFLETFMKSEFNFNKEVYCFNKIWLYHKHTTCFTLYRSRHMTFPGKSLPTKTINVYLPIYKSLSQWAGLSDKYSEIVRKAVTLEQKAYVAHAIASVYLISNSLHFGIPILRYSAILKNPEMELNKLPLDKKPLDLVNQTKTYTKREGFPSAEGLYQDVLGYTDREVAKYIDDAILY